MSEKAHAAEIPAEIFKAYDIRGIVGRTLTPAIVECIGQALGSEARARKHRITSYNVCYTKLLRLTLPRKPGYGARNSRCPRHMLAGRATTKMRWRQYGSVSAAVAISYNFV